MFIVSVYSLFVGDCESHNVYPFKTEDKARELFTNEVERFKRIFPQHELVFDKEDDEAEDYNAHWESGDGDVFDAMIVECDFCD